MKVEKCCKTEPPVFKFADLRPGQVFEGEVLGKKGIFLATHLPGLNYASYATALVTGEMLYALCPATVVVYRLLPNAKVVCE